MVKVD